jgi:class 3 adenylate cyclase/DNA-binding CsgD family transcriptional regulator
MRDLPTGTVTFLFSDIEGSTRLLKELGRERYGQVLALHNEVLRGAFAAEGGTEIDRQGDAFFFVFRSAGSAVAAAVAAQRAMTEAAWPEDGRVRVRIGLHTGEASVSGDGYVGFAVHQAARLGDLGHGGQVLLSRTTAALVEHELPQSIRIRDLGETRLPGLERPEAVFQVVAEGLPNRFPPIGVRRTGSPPPLPEGPRLLEREAEIAALHAYVDAAAAGAGRLVAIEGRAGIGKSRLVAEAAAIAGEAGLAILRARGGELEHDFAYGVVRQLFEPALAAATSEERDDLLSGPAALAAGLFASVDAAGEEDDADVSFGVLHGLYWLAANLALRRPALLLIDDLHWADGPSLRWLTHLQRRLEGLPLLVVVATRPPEQAHHAVRVTEILGDPAAAVVRPTALGWESVATLVHDEFGCPGDTEFVDAVWSATGGNPLFLQALLDTLKRESIEPRAANAETVLEIGPAPVARAVSLRFARLPSEAAVLARAVAVLGGRAEVRHAAALANLDVGLAGHTATMLARAEILRYEMPLEFTHPVVRHAVYDDMSPAERIAAHRRAATILAEARAEPEQIAAHLEHTVPAGDAFVVETLQKAAQRALQRGSSDVAVSLLQRALAEPPSTEAYPEVVRALGLAQRLLDNDEAIRLLDEAFDLIPEPRRRGRIAIELGRCLLHANRHEAAIDAFRRGRDVLAGADDPDLEESAWSEVITAAWWSPEHVEIALAELEQLDESALCGGVGSDLLRAALGYAEARRGGDRERAVELVRAAVAPRRIDSLGARGLHLATLTLTLGGFPDEALEVYDRVLRGAYARGDNVLASAAAVYRAYTQLRRGDLHAAESDLFRFSELMAWETTQMYGHAFNTELAVERGELDRAEELVRASGLPELIPPNGHLMFFQFARARLRLEQHRYDDAVRELEALRENLAALRIENGAFYDLRAHLALAYHAVGRKQEALATALEAVDVARGWGAPQTVGVALRALGLVEGGVSGEKLLRDSLAALEESQFRLERARTLVELGAALRRGNKRSDSRDYLRQGLELAHKLGAAALEERAQTELAATGARPRRVMLSGVESLTPSERRVAEMAADNMTNKDIAQALFVTPKTVEVHLSSVYRKLEISSRAQLPAALGATA